MKEIIAAVVINPNKEILIVDNHGNWSLPGGTKETNESDLECLTREFAEEFSGTKIHNLRHYKDFRGRSPRQGNEIIVRAYLTDILGDFHEPDGRDEDVKRAVWERNFDSYKMALIAMKIIDSLFKDKYL